MTQTHIEGLRRLPSLRALYVFEAAARHLNLVQAAKELGVTQGALSRHVRTLENYVGVPLFLRTSRGLQFTEAGDILWAHCQRAFEELHEGLGAITGTRDRETLVIAIARSYATRVLSHKIGSFVEAYPSISLVLDGHRHLANLARNEADAAIRVGDGNWPDVMGEKIEDDPLFPVAAPSLIAQLGTDELQYIPERAVLLDFTERSYWETWSHGSGSRIPNRLKSIQFSETVMVLEAAEAGQGIAIARRSLVREAIKEGRLVRLPGLEVDDGIGYFFCATEEGRRKKKVKQFRDWIFGPMSPSYVSGLPHSDGASQLSDRPILRCNRRSDHRF